MKKDGLFAFVVVALLGYSAYAAFYIAPDEKTMHLVQRIFYLHAPCGMTALVAFLVAFVGNVGYLVKRENKWDWLGIAGVEVGLAFCTVVLLTGPIWAKPAWGVWWAWDARLTSTLVLWLLYVSYLLLRTMIEDPDRRALVSAFYGVFSFLDVPLVYGSIWWWRTQHPQPVVFTSGGLDPTMRKVFYLSWVSLTLLMVLLIRKRYELEELRSEVQALEREAEA
ncbi:MAG TPA: cytochrome c biogenesis protein CcsA [Terriglobales bacterium]|nr:cytochrome c biogenesis protein CcsA [Terriglobales bacterium]